MKNKKQQKLNKEDSSVQKASIIDAYLFLIASKQTMFPTRSELLSLGVNRDKIRHHFGTLKDLREAAKAVNPDLFNGVIETEAIDSSPEKLLNKIKRHKKFFITTAVNGQWVHEGFLKSIETFCKKENALLLVLPCHDPAHNLDNNVEWHFDEKITNFDIVFDRVDLNSNIHISDIRVTAKQVNPTTGLGRFVQGQGSSIFGSPKQSLEYIPVSNVKYPHAMMSTGSMTVPNYKSTRGNSLRSAFIAHHDHVIGGLIVEVQDRHIYHFRQVQADNDGCFADLGNLYTPNSIKKYKPSVFVLGDYHAGQHDESAVKAWEEVIKKTNVETLVLHDLYNGQSISHHEASNIIIRAKHAKETKLSLKKELEITGKELNRLLSKAKNLVVVKSNHDEFLDRWLQDGRFSSDPLNFELGCLLAGYALNNKDPLKEAIRDFGNVKKFDNIKWLIRDEDFKIAGIECGSHGDKGPNGSRGSIKSLEKAYGKCVIGHSHSPGILRGVWQVGTTSLFDLGYNIGPSSWMHTSCLVYPNGQRQLINSIDGNWHLK